MMFILILFFHLGIKASDQLDQLLSSYIHEFNLKVLEPPKMKRDLVFNLGHKLFHEAALSGNNNIRCLDCHHPRVMTQDNLPLALGEGAVGIEFGRNKRLQANGKILARNTQALFNLHNIHTLFWDGRVEYNTLSGHFTTPVPLPDHVLKTLKSALAAQALFPLVDHDEMRGQRGSNPIADAPNETLAWEMILEKILSMPEYNKLFQAAFPGEIINIGHVGEALAEFQSQQFYFADTPYDRYLKGDKLALTQQQKLGMEIFFNKAKCGQCHTGEHLSGLDFDNVASPQIGPGKQEGDDFGRFNWNQDEDSKYAFRVPPLRNVALTAPYFHNGSIANLELVVEHYNDIKKSLEGYRIMEQLSNYLQPLKDHDHSTNPMRISLLPNDLPLTLELTSDEKVALIEFLRTGLTDIRLKSNIK